MAYSPISLRKRPAKSTQLSNKLPSIQTNPDSSKIKLPYLLTPQIKNHRKLKHKASQHSKPSLNDLFPELNQYISNKQSPKKLRVTAYFQAKDRYRHNRNADEPMKRIQSEVAIVSEKTPVIVKLKLKKPDNLKEVNEGPEIKRRSQSLVLKTQMKSPSNYTENKQQYSVQQQPQKKRLIEFYEKQDIIRYKVDESEYAKQRVWLRRNRTIKGPIQRADFSEKEILLNMISKLIN